MKKSALAKDTLREIKKSFGRFISIFAIVGIGVAFFAGVKASVPVMKNSADAYFDSNNLMDLKVMSTIGITKEDAASIAKLKGVEGVYPSYSMDAITVHENSQKVFKLMSLPIHKKNTDVNYINQPRVIKGRLPQNENECVIESSKIRTVNASIGDTITFESGTDTSIKDALKTTTYTIVGEVTTPYYLSFEKGSSTIGSGRIDSFAYIPDSNFKGTYFSELYLTIKDVKELNSYDDKYFDTIEPVEDAVKKVEEENAKARFTDIKLEAEKKLEEGKKELTKQTRLYNDGIAQGKAKLESSRKELITAQQKLDNSKKESAALFKEKEDDMQKNEAQLTELKTITIPQLKNKLKTLQTQNNEVSSGLQQVEAGKKEVEANIKQIEMALQNPQLDEAEKKTLTQQLAQLTKKQQELQTKQTELKSNQASIKEGISTLQQKIPTLITTLQTSRTKLEDGKQQLASGKQKASVEFEKAQAKIDQGKKDLRKGEIELTKKETDGAAELEKAQKKLKQGEVKLADLKNPSVYVLNRQSHYSYMDYGSAADRMGAISKVFPLFFFLVAALVCLTTMTRMVDEQRQEIGALKALGYTKGYIAMKYVSYAGIASVLGGIAGAGIGMALFPTVIYNAWGIMYNMPGVTLSVEVPLALTAISLSVVITVAASIMAVYKELSETPALLLRPKAPKNGKTIILERITFIWKHFNFIHKVTARNIFRYKKRFFMTVIGISGCTALLVAGFGIRDSIGEIATKQYSEIYKFNVSMTLHEQSSKSEKDKVYQELKENSNVLAVAKGAVYHGFYDDNGEEKGVDLYISKDISQMEQFVSMHNRQSKETYTLDNDGVIITEKLANLKDVSINDSIVIDNGDGIKKSLKVKGIMENYVGHSVFMTDAYYQKAYDTASEDTTLYAILKDNTIEDEQRLGNDFMQKDVIDSVSFYSGIAQTFQDTISSLSFVVVVLIISAGLLAFVVLYNLTNVNVSERLREIATIKVLGFYDNEVSAYVYRENIVLTVIGSIVGLFVGTLLHGLIMNLAEMETVMFGREIAWLSFMYSFVITMVFAVIVNMVMYRKLRGIPMVESLKSVE